MRGAVILFLGLLTACAPAASRDATPAQSSSGPPLEVVRETGLHYLHEKIGELGQSVAYARQARVKPGEAIAFLGGEAVAPAGEDSAFFFIDDAPAANWEHPCRYVFYGLTSGRVTVIPGRLPPRELGELVRLN